MNHYIYIFHGSHMNPDEHVVTVKSDAFTFLAVGVSHLDDAVQVAVNAVANGAQAVELCGAFNDEHVQKIKQAINNSAPVGRSQY